MIEGGRTARSPLRVGCAMAGALCLAAVGCFAAVLTAAWAMGNASTTEVASALAAAAIASLAGLALGIWALGKSGHALAQIVATLSLLANGGVAITALAFATSFHW